MSRFGDIRETALVILLWTAAIAVPCGAEPELKIIANPQLAVSEISADDLRSIFLGTRTSLKDCGQVQPVLEKNGAGLSRFATASLGKSPAALETYYRSLVFTGKWSMPLSFATDAEVIDYVARTRGAIGFIRETAPADRVKTLRVRGEGRESGSR